jgi:hypothetical protein
VAVSFKVVAARLSDLLSASSDLKNPRLGPVNESSNRRKRFILYSHSVYVTRGERLHQSWQVLTAD